MQSTPINTNAVMIRQPYFNLPQEFVLYNALSGDGSNNLAHFEAGSIGWATLSALSAFAINVSSAGNGLNRNLYLITSPTSTIYLSANSVQASGDVYAVKYHGDGSLLTGISGGSVGALSAQVNATTTFLTAYSGNWQNTYTTVCAYSASWGTGGGGGSNVSGISGNWQNTYTTVSANSANWNTAYTLATGLTSLSSNWQSTYTTVSSNSANWNTAYTLVQGNSASWNNALSAYTFIADGSTSIFKLSSTAPFTNAAGYIVAMNGAIQTPNTDFTITYSGTNYLNLNFTPRLGALITVQVLGNVGIGTSSPYSNGTGCSSIQPVSGTNRSSGTYSVVGGGCGNNALSGFDAISSGTCNYACGMNSFIGGGGDNVTKGLASNVAGGFANQALSAYSNVAGGWANTASGYGSHVGGGIGNVVSGNSSSINGGYNNTNSGFYSFIAGGSGNNNSFTNTFLLGSNLSASQNNYTYTNNLSVQGTASIGTPTLASTLNNSILTVIGAASGSTFNQIQNTYASVSASTDLSFYNDSGTTYLDIGINSTKYNGSLYGPTFNIVGPGDSYLYPTSGNLAIGTANNGTGDLVLFTGGTTTSSERMRVTNSGNVGIGTSTPNTNLTVAGSISATGQVTAVGNSYIVTGSNTLLTGGLKNVFATVNPILLPSNYYLYEGYVYFNTAITLTFAYALSANGTFTQIDTNHYLDNSATGAVDYGIDQVTSSNILTYTGATNLLTLAASPYRLKVEALIQNGTATTIAFCLSSNKSSSSITMQRRAWRLTQFGQNGLF